MSTELAGALGAWLSAVAGKLDADRGAYLSQAFLLPSCEVSIVVELRAGRVSLRAALDDGSHIELHRERIGALLLRPPVSLSA